MNNNKIDEINKLLETKPELKTDKVYERDIEFIKEVLDMPEWNDPKFKEVLTPNIWRSNIKDIKLYYIYLNGMNLNLNIY